MRARPVSRPASDKPQHAEMLADKASNLPVTCNKIKKCSRAEQESRPTSDR